ncbi:unnamed protein product [Acanthocheilonema viteae]|uniref:Uncharacterized protein n=1 Tax=Acanthocheilonema viteae TaxID=6277 RepID=A0A498SQV9_ACAVI|nr:unnamed protein product [Acanthocheilonema viteae]
MVKGDQWHGYDNEETIKIKMKWLKEKGYGGAFIWALDFDDFKGTSCGKGPYPLLNALNNELRDGFVFWSSMLAKSNNEILRKTGRASGSSEIETIKSGFETVRRTSDIKCLESYGLFPHPDDCHLFIHCANDYPYVKQCPLHTFFNDDIKICDHLVNAPITCK